jgi:hypothetical protein
MTADKIVPITQGNLRAFMYENYAKGKADERARIIEYLIRQGIIRQSMFGDSLVARMCDTPESEDVWPILDLPADLGASQIGEPS